MNTRRISTAHRLTAFVALLAFIFNVVPLHAGLSQPRGSLFFHQSDNLGRRTARTLPDGKSESMSYNRPGTVNGRTDFNGTVTAHTYDTLNRLLTRTVASTAAGVAPVNVSFTYTLSGRRDTMTDSTGVTHYAYDQRDRLTRKETPEGALNYGYEDASGLLTNMHSDTPSGAVSNYAYDELGRLQTATDTNGQGTGYGYDEVGNLTGVTMPNGVSTGYAYDELNRLKHMDVGRGQTIHGAFSYAVAPTGHRHRSVESGLGLQPANPTAVRTRTWTYDALWRLRGETLGGGATMPNGTATYTLDAVGNRTARASSIAGIASQTFGYNANDRLNSDSYDANGNTKAAAASQPATAVPHGTITGNDSYDANDRLITRSGAAGSEGIAYDGDGQRVSETVTRNNVTTVTTLLVDELSPTGYAQVVEEKINGVLNKAWHYGHALISQDAWIGGTWTLAYYGYDGHGSVRFLTNAQGTVTDTYEYDAFGTLLANTGATPNRHRYCGEVFDDTLGLYYLRARLMNPLTGRFWTADSWDGSVIDPPSRHKFGYVHGDPVNKRDTNGHSVDSTDFFLDGWAVHRNIGYHFISGGLPGQRLANYVPVSGVLNRADPESNSHTTLDGLGLLGLKPDLVDLTTREVWEIKTTRGFYEGRAQLVLYLAILNGFRDPDTRPWVVGSTYTPPATVKGLFRTVTVYWPINGVILYDPFVSNDALATGMVTAGTVVLAKITVDAMFASLNTALGTAVMTRL